MRSHYSVLTKGIAVLAALFMMASVGTAQPFTEVKGWQGAGAQTTSSYIYYYNYPNNYYYMYGYYFMYDYMNKTYTEWIVSKADMAAAGLCAGPIDAMSLRFIRNPINWQGRMRIWIRSIPSTQYTLTYTSGNSGVNNTFGLNYYVYAATQFGYNLVPGVNSVEVHDDPNWRLPVIATNDTTWVDFVFNKNTFVWDGNTNIVIGMERCIPENGPFTYNYAEFLCTHVRPPNPPGYSSYWPWQTVYGYPGTTYGNCDQGPRYRTLHYLYEYNYQTYVSEYKAMRPVTRLRVSAGVSESFPDNVDPRRITRAGDVYDGSDLAHPKPSLTFYQQVGKTYTITYKITGPAPSENVVYTATTAGGSSTITYTGTSNGYTTYPFSSATGPLSGTNGALDLTDAVGGSYKVEATFQSDCGTQAWNKSFIVAFPNDVATVQIRSPQPQPKKNPLNVTMPLSSQIQNVGLNNVTDVDVRAIVRTYPGGQVLYNEEVNWTGNLATGDRASVDVNMVPFIPTAVGLYTAEFCATLNSANDQQAANDCLPSAGETHIFQVNYNEEAGAGSITVPNANGRFYANRPFQPLGDIVNNGILDLSDVPVRMEIFQINGANRQRVYNEVVVVQSVDANFPNNFAAALFPLFTPAAAGNYEACMTVEYPGDPETANNAVCQTFTVQPNMTGTYTIGLKNAGNPNNYPTFEIAANDLFEKGVSGPVTFELTDAEYTIAGNLQTNNVAFDLSGYVPGMSATNTVTFKPSLERSLSKGSITITLDSPNGIGVLFGQQLVPSNPRSLAREFPTVRSYSNSAGYYTFDGGQQKSIKVALKTTAAFRAPFYMGDGGQNITLKNLVIENAPGTAASYVTSLPQVFYTNGQYTFEADVRTVSGQPRTYSAGIVSRSKMPTGITGNNGERLDTIKNNNNVFMGNEIRGFGYGIVSLGIGDLIKGGVNQFTQYYNQGTRIENNTITGVARAGIYVGHEENAVVANNRIYQIGNSTSAGTTQSAGIMAGGDGTYNTGGLRAVNNEISGVTATTNAWGIVVDQRKVVRQSLGQSATTVSFPVGGSQTYVAGNVVWGLGRSATTGSMAGIHLLTRRGADILTPADGDLFTTGDSVVNNTVVMSNDNVTGSGAIVGVGVQNANGPVVMNNAVALLGNAGAATLTQSALLVQGTLFDAAKSNDWYLPANAPAPMVSNRNAFYAPNSGIARFIEVSHTSELVSAGTQDEFKTLSQWRTWTGQDINSVEGNFVAEHEFKGVAPNQQLRVKVTPQAPIGSILNDRGARIAGLAKDLDGQQRGATGLGYDIGADEFDGRLYVSDLEVQSILSPGAYKSTTGATSDAEYIMTKAPVDVTARVRNSGALPRTNAGVTVKIFVETAASNNAGLANPVWSAAPAVQKTVNIDLTSGASTDVAFGLAGFAPQAYQQLAGYTVPAQFASMATNVTPRYRIEVTTGADENNGNNLSSKVVRFYIQRSQMNIIVSTRGASTTLGAGSTVNQIAGRLNGDSLMKSLKDLGFINDPSGTGLISYDVFDRNAWEPRAVDYTIYRTMFWSHDQSALTRTERDDLRNFVDAGTSQEKKNLALGSQEFPSKHTGTSINADVNFINTVLRVSNASPGTPAAPNYNNKRIVGRAIARNTEETVRTTTYVGDAAPVPALVRLYSDPTTAGIALAAYSYKAGDRTTTDSIAGSATASLTTNVVYIGIDWRHYTRAAGFTGGERVLRGVIDFFEKNGGTVVPVELVSFDAKARGNNVDVFWATASEQNADHFVVERAKVSEEGYAGFSESNVADRDVADLDVPGLDVPGGDVPSYVPVSTVVAAGNSTERRDYGVKDLGLADGTYLYRLVMVDRDGSTSRTSEVEVVIGQNNGLEITSVTPMPVVSTSTVGFRTAEAGAVTVTLIGNDGRVAATLLSADLAAGEHTVDLTAAQMASGAYTVVVTANGQTASMPVTIVK